MALAFVRQHAFKTGFVLSTLLLIAFFYEGTVVLEPGVRCWLAWSSKNGWALLDQGPHLGFPK